MFNNKKFAFHAVLLMIVSLVMMFFYIGLQNDHLNILTPYLQEPYGWDDLSITNPVTAAAIASIFLYLFVAAAIIKYGVKAILLPSIIILALACLGVSLADGNYLVYSVSVFFIRALVVPLQLGAFLLCATWFIKYRGRVLGFVTAGGPLFSIFGIVSMTKMANDMGYGLGVYAVIAGVLLLLAVMIAFGLKGSPEEMNLFPDGLDHRPYSEQGAGHATIGVKQLLGEWRAWQLIISYGIMQFVIVAMMAYMAVRYISLSSPENQPNLFVSDALLWLQIGAASGIPMSFVLGWIDDKLGSIKASLVLNVLFFFAVIPLAIMPVGGNHLLMAIWAFGVACMTGGVSTMHPCVTSYVYGRKLYIQANKWIMTLQAIPMAFAVAFMAAFNAMGMLTMAYYLMIGLLVISLLTIVSMRDIPDANAEDRDYATA